MVDFRSSPPDLVDWPAPERNKGPILDVLRRVLPASGLVLEIASGTGQHIAHFAAQLPRLTFQPSDVSDEHLAELEARVLHVGLANLRRPIRLDVSARPWPLGACGTVYCANMVHIAPWQATLDLFAGAAGVLPAGAPLVTYGPYSFAGKHVSDSNADFDHSLRERNVEWGVRDVAELERVAQAYGFSLEESVAMPANNFTLIWRRLSGATAVTARTAPADEAAGVTAGSPPAGAGAPPSPSAPAAKASAAASSGSAPAGSAGAAR